MKKLFYCLLCLLMTAGQVYSSTIVADLEQLSNQKTYRLKTARGSLGVSGSNLVATSKAGYEASDFAILNYAGSYYLWSIVAGSFINDEGATSNETLVPLTFEGLDDSKWMLLFNDNYEKIINIYSGYQKGLIINDWSTADAGNKFTIEEIGNFDDTDAQKILARALQNSELIGTEPLYRKSMIYYDYNGDGVMEMFGLYKPSGEGTFSLYHIGLMNDDEILMDLMTCPPGGYYSANIASEWESNKQIKAANSNGDLLIGGFFFSDETIRLIQKASYIVDLDKDGKAELVTINNPLEVYDQQDDGSFLKRKPELVQDSAYLAYLRQLKYEQYNPLSTLGWNVPHPSTDQLSVSEISQSIDINEDGRMDLFAANGKSAYISVSDNAYTQVAYNGSVYPYDLNGDGMLDYLMYDGESIYLVIADAQGKSSQQKIFSNSNVQKILCRDFDHDGDVDVLAYIVDNDNGYTYFVFLRNDGNGTFKKKESSIASRYNLSGCSDFDADGCYELLIRGINKDKYLIKKVNRDFSLTDVSESLSGNKLSMVMDLGDFNNDGYTEYRLTNEGTQKYSYYTNRYSKQTIQNTVPQKMNKPIVHLDDNTGLLRIVWERGQDTETSSCDLTYEVRIGTAPDKSDILFAPSLGDGRRRVVAEGSMGTQLQTLFNIGKYPAGTYYVSVQTVDAGGLGSAWSDEAIYEHSYMAPIIIAENNVTSTAESLTVVAGNYNKNVTYRWSVSNGEVLSQKNNQAQVKFYAACKQQVMLTTIYNGIEYQSEPLSIDVEASSHNGSSDLVELGVILDINQDGYPDGVDRLEKNFVVNDGNGNMTKYNKSFNSNLSLKDYALIDANKDGFPDVIHSKGVLINDCEGDFELSSFDQSRSLPWVTPFVDFTNTGKYEAILGYTSYNSGTTFMSATTEDGQTFDFVGISWLTAYDKVMGVYDINRDGFMDIVIHDNESEEICAMMNQGNGGYEKKSLLKTNSKDGRFADVNNDGFMDYVTAYYIYLGQPDYTLSKAIEIGNTGSYVRAIGDYDNNGYPDVMKDGTLYFDSGLQHYFINGDYNQWEGYSNSFYENDNYFVVMNGDGYPGPGYYTSSIKNEVPKAPTTVTVKQTAKGLVINWSDAEDDHTPGVQMRYNVSVKSKGKTGANSYVISPMNGGIDKSSLVFPWTYKQSTTMTVPNSALTAGETYEVQVQSIDLWNQCSPMSAPVEITISAEAGVIEVPDMACVGRETIVRCTSALSQDAQIDFGSDSQYQRNSGNSFTVTWSSEGVKNITIGNLHSQIVVKQPVDVSFALPEDIFAGAELPISVNKELAALGDKVKFQVTRFPLRSKATVTYTSGSNVAWLKIDKAGEYTVMASCEDDVLGGTYELTFEAKEAPNAAISRVDVENGLYSISWSTTGWPESWHKVVVYKEGSNLNQFAILDTVDVTRGHYTDQASAPQNVSARYKIALLSDGGQSFESAIHKPLHVMIAASALGGYNLMWNSYEGLIVDNYRIWRGSSVDNMELLTQIAGSLQSYTDNEVSEGEVFYAVSFVPVSNSSANAPRRAPASVMGNDVCSNIVSTRSASKLISATSLSIIGMQDNPELTADNRTMQLYYLLLPTYSTYRNVAWSITKGEDLATISSDGLVTAKEGTGQITIMASTLDGSNLTATCTINVNVPDDSSPVVITAKSYTREYGAANPTFEYTVEGSALLGQPEIVCEATTTSPVGEYPIVIKKGSVTNDNDTYVNGVLTITKAPLSIAAGKYTMKQGETLPEFTLTYSGFKNNETKDVLTKQPVVSCEATAASVPGEYPVTVSGAEAQNYAISYTNGKLTVTEAEPDKPLVETFTLNCKRGYVGYDGESLYGTTETGASQFAIIEYGETNYLYDATHKAFVIHTTAAKAGTTGNNALESSIDFSKAVTGLKWGETGFANYPWYLEDSFGNWMNMDQKPRVYMNTWKNFENANGGNTYQKTIVDVAYDATEALEMLDNYFNPQNFVVFEFTEPGNVVSRSEALPVKTGSVINEVPTDMCKDYCIYDVTQATMAEGENVVKVRVSCDLPFETSSSFESATWYLAKVRYNYYLNMGNSEPYYPTATMQETNNFQWAFMGTPHTGFVILNKAAGADKCLTKVDSYALMRQSNERWELIRNAKGGFNVLRRGSDLDYITQYGGNTGYLGFWVDTRGRADIGGMWLLEEVTTNINAIDANSLDAMIYDLNGNRLSKPQRGVNIIRMKNGNTRKVLVK